MIGSEAAQHIATRWASIYHYPVFTCWQIIGHMQHDLAIRIFEYITRCKLLIVSILKNDALIRLFGVQLHVLSTQTQNVARGNGAIGSLGMIVVHRADIRTVLMRLRFVCPEPAGSLFQLFVLIMISTSLLFLLIDRRTFLFQKKFYLWDQCLRKQKLTKKILILKYSLRSICRNII